MKTNARLFKPQFLYLFLLIGIAVSFNSCNDDDDAKNFLEKYANTVWLDEDESYFRIVNDLSILAESWENYGECYDYGTLVGDHDEGTWDIIENSENKFVAHVTHEDTRFDFTITLTASNNTLTVKIESDYEDDEIIVLTSSNTDVDSLQICQ